MNGAVPFSMWAIGTCGSCWGPVCRPVWIAKLEESGTRCVAFGASPRTLYDLVLSKMRTELELRIARSAVSVGQTRASMRAPMRSPEKDG